GLRLQPDEGRPSVGRNLASAPVRVGGSRRRPLPVVNLGGSSAGDQARDQGIARAVEVGHVVAAAALALVEVGVRLTDGEPVAVPFAPGADELEVTAGDRVDSQLD